jgi:hypothetical protein
MPRVYAASRPITLTPTLPWFGNVSRTNTNSAANGFTSGTEYAELIPRVQNAIRMSSERKLPPLSSSEYVITLPNAAARSFRPIFRPLEAML